MSFNSYKEDEELSKTGKMHTLLRMLSYLLSYKKELTLVLFIIAFCIIVSLINPLLIEEAIDNYISAGNGQGLFRLVVFALILNLLMIGGIKLRMYIMAKVCNSILIFRPWTCSFLTAGLREKSLPGSLGTSIP